MAKRTLRTHADFERCFALDVTVEVVDLNGETVGSGLLTDFAPNSDIFTVGGRQYNTREYMLYADVPIAP